MKPNRQQRRLHQKATRKAYNSLRDDEFKSLVAQFKRQQELVKNTSGDNPFYSKRIEKLHSIFLALDENRKYPKIERYKNK